MNNQKNLLPIIGVLILAILISAGFILGKGKGSGTAGTGGNEGAQFTFNNAVGKRAPDFNLTDMEGKNVSLKGLAGKNVILFFNEGLMCYPACLNQVVELSKDSRFNSDNTVAFSVVVDSPKNWQDALQRLPYLASAKVLFDNQKSVSRAYDVLSLDSVMHRGLYPGHTYFIIDKEGIIRFALDDPNMGLRNDELFSALQKI